MSNKVKAPHIGEMILREIKQRRLSKAALARSMDLEYKTIINYTKRKDLHVSTLFELSQVLHHNFIGDLAILLPVSMPGAVRAEDEAKDREIAALQAELQQVKLERDTLQKVIELLGKR